jgi:hypothetical protein
MARYDLTLAETPLVKALVTAGLRQRRAVSFERWLDDQRPCGISSCFLAALMSTYASNYRERTSTPEGPDSASVFQCGPVQSEMHFLSSAKARKMVQR